MSLEIIDVATTEDGRWLKKGYGAAAEIWYVIEPGRVAVQFFLSRRHTDIGLPPLADFGVHLAAQPDEAEAQDCPVLGWCRFHPSAPLGESVWDGAQRRIREGEGEDDAIFAELAELLPVFKIL